MFKVDYSGLQENNFQPLPTGEYEMLITQVQQATTKNGKEKIQYRLTVRNDLTQVPELAETNGKYANRIVFNDEWKRDINGDYQFKTENLMYVLQAAQVPEGTSFASFEDFEKALTNKPVRVYVKKEWDDYNNEDTNTVAPWGYSQSKFPQVAHQFKGNDSQATEPQPTGQDPFETTTGTEIDESDLPF